MGNNRPLVWVLRTKKNFFQWFICKKNMLKMPIQQRNMHMKNLPWHYFSYSIIFSKPTQINKVYNLSASLPYLCRDYVNISIICWCLHIIKAAWKHQHLHVNCYSQYWHLHGVNISNDNDISFHWQDQNQPESLTSNNISQDSFLRTMEEFALL